MTDIPGRARVVIIGGGVIGTSVAYHLAQLGWTDVLLLEQGQLSCGSTWHAAGLVGQLRSSASITQVLRYSVGLYGRLKDETGLETGWKMTGCLRLATNQERWTEYRRLATTAQSFGLEMHLLSPAEVKAMWPLMEVGDLVAKFCFSRDHIGILLQESAQRPVQQSAAIAGCNEPVTDPARGPIANALSDDLCNRVSKEAVSRVAPGHARF